ncbi:MAG: twin-arginine translocation signal domain-containing protein [Planctomycetota bacterium]
MSCSRSNRRKFLRSTAALGAAGALAPYWLIGRRASAGEPTSKNDRPLIGVVGPGGRGLGDAHAASQFGDVVAVCDVDRNRAEQAKAAFDGKPDVYRDYRRLVERDDVEVIVNGTPEEVQKLQTADPTLEHMRNFFECVKSREEPVSPVRVQHRTVTACHLTNLSLRLGRKLTWDPESEQILGDDEARAWQKRDGRAPYVIEA